MTKEFYSNIDTKRKPWTIHQLYEQLQEDLKSCQTQLEKDLCYTICAKEIRQKAEVFKQTRKLNPGEISILGNLR